MGKSSISFVAYVVGNFLILGGLILLRQHRTKRWGEQG